MRHFRSINRFFGFMLISSILSTGGFHAARASWLVEQLNPEFQHHGWITRVSKDEDGVPVVLAKDENSLLHIYELGPGSSVTRTIYSATNFDLASSKGGANMAVVRHVYDSSTTQRSVQVLQRTGLGTWSSEAIDSDLGANSSGCAVAVDESGTVWVAYQRAKTQSIELAMKPVGGTWSSSTVASGPEYGSHNALDLALSNSGEPHVMISRYDSHFRHAWLEGGAWQSEDVPLLRLENWLGHGAAFDREGHLIVSFSRSERVYSTASLLVREDSGWSTVSGSQLYTSGPSPSMALDALGRPHLVGEHYDAGFFGSVSPRRVTHRWFNGQVWRQENIAGWSSNVTGRESQSIWVDHENIVSVAFTDSGTPTDPGNLYRAFTLGTPYGIPLAIPASYDLKAVGQEDVGWDLSEGDTRIAVSATGETESRLLLSFDLSTLPAGAKVVGAELDLQQIGITGIAFDPQERGTAWGFADDGIAQEEDADLGLDKIRLGFLDGTSATSDEQENLTVLRLDPYLTAALIESGATDLGILIASNGNLSNGSFDTIEKELLDSRVQAPRLWLYYQFEGDVNLDGVVDDSDLDVILSGYGNSRASVLDGDADGNGVVDGNDFLVWQRNYGEWSAVTATVPEPSMALMTSGALVQMLLRRCSLHPASTAPRMNQYQVV